MSQVVHDIAITCDPEHLPARLRLMADALQGQGGDMLRVQTFAGFSQDARFNTYEKRVVCGSNYMGSVFYKTEIRYPASENDNTNDREK
jgi:hypothetical protein